MWTYFWLIVFGILLAFLILIFVRDFFLQKKHAILRNFPILGHARYFLELIGPELRQYIVARNDEERPFSRDQRSWVYASSKNQNNYSGFGTDNDLELSSNYLVVQHSPFPLTKDKTGYDEQHRVPCQKIMGEHRGRAKKFRPESIVNVSAMSLGSLSKVAVEAINRGCHLAGCLHNTGEGGVAQYHDHQGDLIWQIGTGYFGCRDKNGDFCFDEFKEVISRFPIKAIEVKLSQGAKPGMGGLLPASKVTPEIASIRKIPVGQDCASPAGHKAFHDVDSMLDFVEKLAEASGLPVGIKSAVGEVQFWTDLADQMSKTDRGVDYIAVDGGEGGTGAGPLVFVDHVSLPFKLGFVRVYHEFLKAGIQDNLIFIGAGKLGFPDSATIALALGCDMINVAREAMMAIGCIQAQKCHTGHCPTGVATNSRWLMRGLDPTDKGARLANYVRQLRKDLLSLSHACGVEHPSLISPDTCEILNDQFASQTVTKTFQLDRFDGWGKVGDAETQQLNELMRSLRTKEKI